jgi:hypothetical protein
MIIGRTGTMAETTMDVSSCNADKSAGPDGIQLKVLYEVRSTIH